MNHYVLIVANEPDHNVRLTVLNIDTETNCEDKIEIRDGMLKLKTGGGIAQLVSRLPLNLGTWVRIPVGA